MDLVVSQTPTPWQYLQMVLQTLGWPALVWVAIKVSVTVTRMASSIAAHLEKHDKALGQIDVMSVNCFPTMQRELIGQSASLKSMDDSLRRMAGKRKRK